MQTLTQEQFKKLYGEKTLASFGGEKAKILTESTGIGGYVSSSLYNVGKKATEAYESIGKNLNRIQEAQAQGKTGGTESLRMVTEPIAKGIEAVFAPVTTLIEGGAGGVIPKVIGSGVTEAMKVPEFQSFASKIAELTQKYPQEAGLLGDITEIASTFLGAKLAKEPVDGAIKSGIKTVGETAGAISGGIDKGIDVASTAIKPVSTLAESAISGVKNIPSKIATNVAEKQAKVQAIKSLPTETAQKTAKMGVDIADVNTLLRTTKTQKPAIKKLVEVVKNFSKGVSNARPDEVIGKPMTQALKKLDSMKSSVGKKLGEIADTLGEVSGDELVTPVLERLKKVSGLEGLKNNGGILDFSDTVLGSSLTSADQKAIQEVFLEAIQGGTGKQKHLLRQTLFETLGGKKKALANITDTQERAYEAIRKGLADVLDTKNPTYKALNMEYAKISEPLKKLRKTLQGSGIVDEDLLEMSAGNLARRLTSNAKSNPEIRQVLRNIDNLLKTGSKKGETLLNLENLQDIYNVLDKYYDIAPKTGFQGQIKSAIGSPTFTGKLNEAIGAVSNLAGETPAVRQKAIEKLLEELLR